MLHRLFLAHPRDLGESWATHARASARFGVVMIGGGLACLLHAVVPGLATTTGSRTIAQLHSAMIANRRTGTNGGAHAHAHYLDGGAGI